MSHKEKFCQAKFRESKEDGIFEMILETQLFPMKESVMLRRIKFEKSTPGKGKHMEEGIKSLTQLDNSRCHKECLWMSSAIKCGQIISPMP